MDALRYEANSTPPIESLSDRITAIVARLNDEALSAVCKEFPEVLLPENRGRCQVGYCHEISRHEFWIGGMMAAEWYIELDSRNVILRGPRFLIDKATAQNLLK